MGDAPAAAAGCQRLAGVGAGDGAGLRPRPRPASIPFPGRPRPAFRVPDGVVVLHRQPGDRAGPALRLPADVLPARPGPTTRVAGRGSGGDRNLLRPFRRHRCAGEVASLHRALQPRRGGPGGRERLTVPRVAGGLVGRVRGVGWIECSACRLRWGLAIESDIAGDEADRGPWRRRPERQERPAGKRLVLPELHAPGKPRVRSRRTGATSRSPAKAGSITSGARARSARRPSAGIGTACSSATAAT